MVGTYIILIPDGDPWIHPAILANFFSAYGSRKTVPDE
jgi:hypothetical protein